jgi:hypothetical protein
MRRCGAACAAGIRPIQDRACRCPSPPHYDTSTELYRPFLADQMQYLNINNINKRLSNLLDWLRVAEPDVVCLQELKAIDAEFPAARYDTQATKPSGGAKRPGMASRSSHAAQHQF